MLTRTNCVLDKLHVTSEDNMFRKVSEAVKRTLFAIVAGERTEDQ